MTESKQAYIQWGDSYTVHNQTNFPDAGADAREIHPGKFGSQYPRMCKLINGDWLVVYTIYNNNGYTYDPAGGNILEIAVSKDNARTWQVISTLSEAGRDLDNGQIIQLEGGTLLMGLRSVRWQESYKLYVYRSFDFGVTWSYLSTIDENEGEPGSLGNPDKGVYETHFYILDDGHLSVMYASEKYVTASPPYSQVVSQKVSTDFGVTWGKEIWVAWDTENEKSRPGMPVWTKMANGKYIVVLEVCGTRRCEVFFKISEDGVTWESGLGNRIPEQKGGPYVEALTDGTIVVTSNSHKLSISHDFGRSWYTNDSAPWGSWDEFENVWPSIYQTGVNEIAFITSTARANPGMATEGHNIKIKFGTF